jgi:hypothetical protein
MAVSINPGTNAGPVGLTCWSADPAARQRRPTKRCANVVVICHIAAFWRYFGIPAFQFSVFPPKTPVKPPFFA